MGLNWERANMTAIKNKAEKMFLCILHFEQMDSLATGGQN
jgi:hypothetical protein